MSKFLLSIITLIAAQCLRTMVVRGQTAPRPVRLAIDRASLGNAIDAAISAALPSMLAAGYRYWVVPIDHPHAITFERRRAAHCATDFVGYWDRERSVISIAPNCIHGPLEMRHVIVHELLHSLGARHVCRNAAEIAERRRTGDDCPLGRYGVAVLNAYTAYDGVPTPYELTGLDMDELRRIGAAGTLASPITP